MTESTTPRTYDTEYLSHYLRGLAKDLTQGDPEAAGVLIRASHCISEGVSTWIACAERLPTEGQRVAVWRPKYGGDYGTDFLGVDGDWVHSDGWTHWMPLPEAPK